MRTPLAQEGRQVLTTATVQEGATQGRSPLKIDPSTAEERNTNPNKTVN